MVVLYRRFMGRKVTRCLSGAIVTALVSLLYYLIVVLFFLFLDVEQPLRSQKAKKQKRSSELPLQPLEPTRIHILEYELSRIVKGALGPQSR